MKLFFHYCSQGFANCYIVGTEYDKKQAVQPPHEALIIDPGSMDAEILKKIEDHDYNLRGILITHDHLHHIQGIRTLMRIYDTEIYAVNTVIQDHKTVSLKDGDSLRIGPFKVDVFSVPGHSADSAVFRIEQFLFTGDALSAGLLGSTASSYGAAIQINALRSKIFSLPGDYTLLPGHGPPSSLEAERRFNDGLRSYDQKNLRHSRFNVDLEYLN